MAKRTVYTALFGGYETLNEDVATASDVDFVCFTDDPELRSDRWRIVHVEPEFPLDPHRSQRRIKILGHPLLDDYDETLYIDNSVSLHGSVNEFFDTLLAHADMGMCQHSFRASLADEFATVWRMGLDDHHRLMEQWDHYAATYPDVLNHAIPWGGIIARRKSAHVAALSLTWFEHVLRYSRRDQLSAPVAIALHPQVRFAMRALDNFSSPWHTWPVPLSRIEAMKAGASTLRVPHELRVLQDYADTVSELEARLAEASAQRDGAAQELALRSAQHDDLAQALADTTAQLDASAVALANTSAQLDASTGALAEKSAQLEALTQASTQALAQALADSTAQLEAGAQSLADTTAQLDAATAALADKSAQLDALEQTVADMRSSNSWRLTRPLRALRTKSK